MSTTNFKHIKLCSIKDCKNKIRCIGLCEVHYARKRRPPKTNRTYIRGHNIPKLSETSTTDIPLILFGAFFRREERLQRKKHSYYQKVTFDKRTIGHKHTLEFKLRQSQLKTGSNNPIWKGGKWKENLSLLKEHLRKLAIYKNWRKQIFQRDNYTCQKCHTRGNYLECHHIKNFIDICKENNIETVQDALNCDQLWDIDNGVTLCQDCHDIITFCEMKRKHKEWYNRD